MLQVKNLLICSFLTKVLTQVSHLLLKIIWKSYVCDYFYFPDVSYWWCTKSKVSFDCAIEVLLKVSFFSVIIAVIIWKSYVCDYFYFPDVSCWWCTKSEVSFDCIVEVLLKVPFFSIIMAVISLSISLTSVLEKLKFWFTETFCLIARALEWFSNFLRGSSSGSLIFSARFR